MVSRIEVLELDAMASEMSLSSSRIALRLLGGLQYRRVRTILSKPSKVPAEYSTCTNMLSGCVNIPVLLGPYSESMQCMACSCNHNLRPGSEDPRSGYLALVCSWRIVKWCSSDKWIFLVVPRNGFIGRKAAAKAESGFR